MKLEIFKKGQGKRARVIAYVLGGGLVVFGAYALFGEINWTGHNVWLKDIPVIGEITLYNSIATAVFFLGMLLLHLFLNRASIVDLLIDTELEMKKVSWPSRSEVQSSSLVVVVVTFILAMMLFGFDKILQLLFQLVLGGQ